MDQFISCMGKAGHAILLDCRSLEVKFVPIPTNLRLVVCNTMVKHSLATGAYNTRREECEEGVHLFEKWDPTVRALRDVSAQLLTDHAQDLPATIRKRCSHVVGENERVLETTSVLTEGNLDRLRELMRESHVSLRDLYEVSCHELDIMVDAAQDLPGFCGGRMTGGGFGGCTINLVKEEHAEDFSIQITERYRRATGIGAQVYLCTAEAGAERIS
jgi:galactokinase